VTVVLTIAICIAANTTTFTVVHSVLLRPLPVPDADSIVIMANRYPRAGADFGYNRSSGDYFDRLRNVRAFSDQALSGDGAARAVAQGRNSSRSRLKVSRMASAGRSRMGR
jgi:hypothetical protein